MRRKIGEYLSLAAALLPGPKKMTLEDQWLSQKEKILAWLRLGFSLAALFVVQVNPERLARFPTLSQFSLYSFFLYSLLVLYLSAWQKVSARTIGIATTFLDLVWISLVVFSTGAPRTPFFVYYFFPVITASFRYGTKGSILVALIGVSLYGLIRFSPAWDSSLGLDTFIIRSIYLLVLAYIFGFLADFEERQHQKLMTLYNAAGQAATQEERRRIAAELHDRLLQVLASLTLRLETCRRHLLARPDELSGELDQMEEACRNTMQEIRRFLAGKDSNDFVPGTLIESLREELKFLRDGLGLRVVLESDPEDFTLPAEVEQEIYYVLREGLRNVARHARASSSTISLEVGDGKIEGLLEDDGVGFDLSNAREDHGFGLTTMEERIKKLHGRLSIQSSPGKGTRLLFSAPL